MKFHLFKITNNLFKFLSFCYSLQKTIKKLNIKIIKTLQFKSKKTHKNSQHLTKFIKNFKLNKLNKNNYLVKINYHSLYYNTNSLGISYRSFHTSSKLNKPNFFNKIFFTNNILTKIIKTMM